MRGFPVFLLLLPALTACRPGSAPQPRVVLSHVSLLPHTPVKDQGALPVCWAYAMLSLIESDRMADGDSVNLSAADAVRTAAFEALSAGTLPRGLRGTGVTLLRVVSQTGTAAYDAAPDLSHDAGERLLSEGRKLNAQQGGPPPAPDAKKAEAEKTSRLTGRTGRLTENTGRQKSAVSSTAYSARSHHANRGTASVTKASPACPTQAMAGRCGSTCPTTASRPAS